MNIKKILAVLALLRITQYTKNFFVFAPIIFSGNFSNILLFPKIFLAFLFFCLTSSFVYIINDLYDLKSDKSHPTKSKTRPLANGSLQIRDAHVILFVLFLLIPFSILINLDFFIIIISYISLNIFYTLKLKHEPILDIFSIAISFVLRVISGSFAASLPISSWMCVTTLCLALFLACIKRRQELILNNSKSRIVLNKYSLPLIEKYADISMLGALIFYSFFALSERQQLVVTIPFVLFGLFRYWYLIEQKNEGESPAEIAFRDKPLFFAVVFWIISCVLVI